MKPTLALARKDLRIEFRSKQTISVMFLFSLLVVLAFRFAFSEAISSGGLTLDFLAASTLWVCFSFAAIVGMHASFEREKDRETLEGLLLCPIDRGVLYLGKIISNLTVVFLVNLLSIGFFSIFFAYGYGGNGALVIVIAFIGTLSLVLVGTLISAISVNVRAREAMLPILLIPLIIFTVIMPCVSATMRAISGDIQGVIQQIQFIVGFAVVFGAVSYLTFDFVLEG